MYTKFLPESNALRKFLACGYKDLVVLPGFEHILVSVQSARTSKHVSSE